MLKRILVPLDSSEYTISAMDFSCWLARRHDAELTGLVVLDLQEISESIGPVPAGGFYYAERIEKAREQEALDYIQRLINTFKMKCEKEKIRHRECLEQGVPAKEIIRRSFFYDAVVMGLRTDYQFDEKIKMEKSITEILHHGVTPVYGVPQQIPASLQQSKTLNVLIAFDGSPLSARALQHFTHLAVPDLAMVKIVTSQHDKETGDFFLREADALLQAHGFKNTEKIFTEKDINRTVKEDYYSWADLIVVGAHTKKGVLDFVTGSLTKMLIDEAKEIVLIGL